MKKYRLSLIITTFNQPEFLDLTLASAEAQTFKGFEVLVADDGSDKRTGAIVKKYSHLNLKHVWHKDKGYRKAVILNKAVNTASSDYLVFIDHDCLLHRDFLHYHYKYREAGCFLAGRRVELGKIITQKILKEKINSRSLEKMSRELRKSCFKKDSSNFHRAFPVENKILRKIAGWNRVGDIQGSNLSLYKKDLIEVNGFNEDLKNYWGEDGDLFLRLRNSRFSIKSVKNLAVQYHLFHKRLPPDKKMMKWYYDSVENDYTYRICKNGLKKIRKTDTPVFTLSILIIIISPSRRNALTRYIKIHALHLN